MSSFAEFPDGDSHLTQYVDWSARRYDVLYVASWGNADRFEPRTPSDNFNGITVAASGFAEEDEAMYRKFSPVNSLDGDASGDRTSIDLLAPGEQIQLLGTASTPGGAWEVQGASFAAPHVTGAVALLQQYSRDEMIGFDPNPRFNENSQRHETMKAIMLNSADKLNGVHGSKRDVIDANNATWIETEATSQFISLDDQLGAGHLNVKRAVDQLAPGEYDPGIVPLIGWDYSNVGGVGARNEYIFDQPLGGDQYIAITLCWDRRVTLTDLDDDYLPGDQFFPYNTVDEIMNNLDIHLMTADGTDLILDSVTISESFEDNVEHVFFNDFGGGEYKIVVNHRGGIGDDQDYALAWWFGGNTPPYTPPIPGDFDGDGDVDGDDLPDWTEDFGINTGSGDADGDGDSDGADFLAWQQNLGTTSTMAAAGAVPEPAAWLLAVLGLPLVARRSVA